MCVCVWSVCTHSFIFPMHIPSSFFCIMCSFPQSPFFGPLIHTQTHAHADFICSTKDPPPDSTADKDLAQVTSGSEVKARTNTSLKCVSDTYGHTCHAWTHMEIHMVPGVRDTGLVCKRGQGRSKYEPEVR